jgi:hypothetical protein
MIYVAFAEWCKLHMWPHVILMRRPHCNTSSVTLIIGFTHSINGRGEEMCSQNSLFRAVILNLPSDVSKSLSFFLPQKMFLYVFKVFMRTIVLFF